VPSYPVQQQPSYAPPPPPIAPLPPPPLAGGYGQQAQYTYAPTPTFATTGGPVPPQMHWFVVLILSFITGGLGGIIWMFKEAFFVKKIDPANKAVIFFAISSVAWLAIVVIYFGTLSSGSIEDLAAMSGLILLLELGMCVLMLVGMFGMRSSLVRYYNTTEPIGLKLSGVMTFFFSILYFQYHFSRIGEWKRTGQLR
jgi:uncharacterized membrane protein